MSHPFFTNTAYGADTTRQAIEKVLTFLPDDFDAGAVLLLQCILVQRGVAPDADTLPEYIDIIIFG